MSDPLAFFAADDSSSESDQDDDTKQNNHQDEASASTLDTGDKLPSPDSLFKSVGRPAFLSNPHEKFIDWDRFVKSSESEEPNVHESDGYAAVPPPSSLGNSTTVTSKLTRSILGSGVVEFSSPPVPYENNTASTTSTADRDVRNGGGGDCKQQTPPATGLKRPHGVKGADPVPDVPPNSKRPKGEQFRVKEKRKRDIGQSSRGKSYVEEEKRILRQQFQSDEILS